MKRLLAFSVLLSLFALPVFGQMTYSPTFTTQTFAKATSRTDTSAVITVGAYPNISIRTTTIGTDSANIAVHVDAKINGVWWNDVVASDAVALGRAAGHTIEGSAHTGQVENFVLRDNGRIADLLQNSSDLRVRNVITSGAGDSTSATSYTQKIALRKVTW